MTRLLFIFVLFLTLAIPSLAQTDELDESKMVGFGCFYEGRETRLVSRFGKMLKRKQYSSIARELSSDNSGARVMAVFCLERLQAINTRPLTENEKVVINQNHQQNWFPCVQVAFPQPAFRSGKFSSLKFSGAHNLGLNATRKSEAIAASSYRDSA